MPVSVPLSNKPSESFVHPLLHFKGTLKNMRQEERTTQFGTRTIVFFDFTDVEVLLSREPYAWPTATIEIPWNERANTPWGEFSSDVINMIGSSDVNVLEGKKQEWKWSPCKLNRPVVGEDGVATKQFALQDAECWRVVAIDGFTPLADQESAVDCILRKIDGKTKEQLLQTIYTDPELKASNGWQEAITGLTNNVLLESLITAGRLSKNAETGVYTKVG